MEAISHKIYVCIALSASIGFAGPLFASQDGAVNAGYVTDITGQLVTSISGKCMRTIHWTKSLALSECDPDLVAKKEIKAIPAAQTITNPKPMMVKEQVMIQAGTLFDFDKAELKPEGKAELEKLAGKLQGLNKVELINITGHTDSIGSADYNQQLSERRAAAVKEYLIQMGVSALPIETIGKGANSPVASNNTEEGRIQNRRVNIDVGGVRVTVKN
jgi:OOP family OmpA-OmpF porin